jgi:cell division protein FtsN
MNIKIVKTLAVISLVLLPALSAFAGGTKEPNLVVSGVSNTSRLVSVDWTGVSRPEKYRWGLYRFDMDEKTYSLVNEIEALQANYLDDDLDPPAIKYFYKVERFALNQDLVKSKPVRINKEEVARQMAAPSGEALQGVGTPYMAGYEKAEKKETASKNSTLNEGIYIGIISFSGKVNDITQSPDGTPALIPLDAPGRQVLLEYLTRSYVLSKSNGAALYYANHKALANLKVMEQNGGLPGNLDSITVITFTDSTDTSSTDVDFEPLENRDFRRKSSAAAYRNFISQQLSTRKIGGVQVNAWSIGIPGKDIQNSAEFTQTLQALASGPGNVSEFSEVSQIDERLTAIADGLNIYTPRMNLRLSTPAYPVNTLLRITFDSDISTPDISQYYIDARVGWDEAGKSYTLGNISAHGIKYGDSQRLYGKRNETGIDYNMLLNSDFHVSNVRQWYIQPGEDAFGWLQNGESFAGKTADFAHERKSAVVYLVLDCGMALTDKTIGDIRNAIGVFINNLYNISSREVILTSVNGAYVEQASSRDAAKNQMTAYMPKDGQTQNYSPYTAPSQSAAPQAPQTLTPAQTYQQKPAATPQSPSPVSQPPVQVWQRSNSEFQFPPQELYQKPQVQATPWQTNRQATQFPAASAAPQKGSIEVLSAGNVPGSYNFQNAYWVQIGSYNDVARAQRTWRAFSGTGIGSAEIFTSAVNGITYYRVKAGPYVNKMEAERVLEKLKKYSAEYKDCFITNE